jgi:hypothetical protein
VLANLEKSAKKIPQGNWVRKLSGAFISINAMPIAIIID